MEPKVPYKAVGNASKDHAASWSFATYLVPAQVYLSKAAFANLVAHYELADDRKRADVGVGVSPWAYKNRGSNGAVGVVM
ncbi:hypothetical protein E4U55_003738 [Claviceps digitariae]|nr:hypothetical protein E4U55_003738 [Claviceps digitariae]